MKNKYAAELKVGTVSRPDEAIKRVAASPFWSRVYYSWGYIAFQICMIIPVGCGLWFKLLPCARIYAHSVDLKDWRDRWGQAT